MRRAPHRRCRAGILAHENDIGGRELALDGLGAVTHDQHDCARRKRAQRGEHMGSKGTAGDAVQHLGHIGVHALALAGGQDYDIER